ARVVDGGERADLAAVADEQVDRRQPADGEVLRRVGLVTFVDQEGVERIKRAPGEGVPQLAQGADDEVCTPRVRRRQLPDAGRAPARGGEPQVAGRHEGHGPAPAPAAVEVGDRPDQSEGLLVRGGTHRHAEPAVAGAIAVATRWLLPAPAGALTT